MLTLRLMGVFTIIPITIFLTVSFFVMFAIRKIDIGGLKAFGYVVAVMLWICVGLFFSVGIYTMATGRHPMMVAMQQMMQAHMSHCAMQGQMQGPMQGQMKCQPMK